MFFKMDMEMEMTYVCGSCGKGFKRSDNLKKHLLIHTGVRPFQCSVCGKSFRERNHLTSHVLLHTGEKPYKCSHCGRAFNQNSNLKKHIRIHLNDRPHACSICSNRFTQQCYLNEHMKIHTGERAYECFDCGKKFKNSSHLKSHRKTHSDERPYKCSFCDKTFKYVRNYSLHVTSHDGGASCSCSECGRQFLNRNHLKLHMLSHSKVKLQECFVCGKGFRKLDQFKRHLQVHTGERPFKCLACDEGFRSSTHLKYHMMLHTGEKPFTCNVCGNGFRSKSYLNSHMVSHDLKRHQCGMCGKSFKYKCNYTRHIKSHDEVKVEDGLIDVSPSEQSNSLNHVDLISSRELPPLMHVVNSEDFEVLPLSMARETVEEEKKIKVFSCSAKPTRSLDHSEGSRTLRTFGLESNIKPSVKIVVSSSSDDYPFHCSHCSDTFRQEHQLKEHLNFHTYGPYHCSFCKVYFCENDLLQAHMKKHVTQQNEGVTIWSKDNIECKLCGKKFQRKYLLRRHMLVHKVSHAFKDKTTLKTNSLLPTGNRKYACGICGKKFMQSCDLKRHTKIHEISNDTEYKPFSCSVCGLRFCYKHNLETHEMVHVMRGDFVLKEKPELGSDNSVGRNVTTDKNIIHTLIGNIVTEFDYEEPVTHIITEEEMERKPTSSPKDKSDKREFVDQTDIKLEPYRVGGVSKLSYMCVICGLNFKEQVFLKSHMRQHKPECPQCGKLFKRLNNLKRHMGIHSDIRPYNCNICVKSFKENRLLKSHLMLVHGVKRVIKCEICGKKLSQNTYPSHMKIHSGEKPNDINPSGSEFGMKQVYEAHQLNHDVSSLVNEIDYVLAGEHAEGKSLTNSDFPSDCVENSIAIADEARTETSVGRVGTDEKLLKCSTCENYFGNKGNMKRQIQCPNAKQPYNCSSCGKRFKEENYSVDLDIEHSRTCPKDCKMCSKRSTQKSSFTRHRKTPGSVYAIHKSGPAAKIAGGNKSTVDGKSKSIRIPEGDVEVTKQILGDLSEITVEIQLGKLAIQTIPYEAALRRRQILKERRLHKCIQCNKCFNRKSNLARHMQSHKEIQFIKESPVFFCFICDNTFESKSLFDSHLATHVIEYPSNIEICKKPTLKEEIQKDLTIRELERKRSSVSVRITQPEGHVPVISDMPSKNMKEKRETFICNLCDMEFHFKHHLESHRQIHEWQQKIGNEKDSHHKIVIKSRQTKPKESTDKGNQELVGKERKSNLIIVKERPISNVRNLGELELGKITVKTLPYRLALKNRLESCGKKKRVQCEVCANDFSSKYNLKVHMRLHTGEKPYACTYCGEKFHQYNYMKNHINKSHDSQVQAQPPIEQSVTIKIIRS